VSTHATTAITVPAVAPGNLSFADWQRSYCIHLRCVTCES